MSRVSMVASAWVIAVCLVCEIVSGFVAGPCKGHARALYLKSQAGNEDESAGRQRTAETTEAFMERTSRDGAEKIRSMSIEERTKRAMLAEAIEDRMFSLNDDLELLLEPNGLPVPENREKVQTLVREIKSAEKQYEELVSGNPSSMLGALDAIGNALDSDDSEMH